ncbi:hypothetical protein PS2_000707 [Malus domestica]
MGTLQSRFDAEFLMAYMCSVKFKEWIVVLATLLRRSEEGIKIASSKLVRFNLAKEELSLRKSGKETLLWTRWSIAFSSWPMITGA